MGLVAVWSFVPPLVLTVPRSRWFRFPLVLAFVFGSPARRCFRVSLLWLWSFCVCGDFVCQNCWFALGVGIGPSLLALVLVVLFVRLFRFICSDVRRPALVDPVEIWPKSEKFAT